MTDDPNAHPLTSVQRDIFEDQLLIGNVPTYNVGGYLVIEGALDVTIFERSLKQLILDHDALRLVIGETGDGRPFQSVAESVATELEQLDFSEEPDSDERARAWIDRKMNEPFRVIGGRLFRWALLRTGPDRSLWFICVHHLIADGWAMDTLFAHCAETYRQLQQNLAPASRAPSFLATVADDTAYLRSDRFGRDRAFWRAEYESLPEPLLTPRTVPRAGAASGERSWVLDRSSRDAVDAVARTGGSTRYQVFLALFCAFMVRLRDRDGLTIGLSVLNRRTAVDRATVGLFANVIPLSMQLGPAESLIALSARLGPMLRRRYRHQRFPIGTLNRELALFRQQRSQLYELSISYEHGGRRIAFGEAIATAVRCSTASDNSPLRLCIRDNQDTGDVAIHLIHGPDHIAEAEIAPIAERFHDFIRSALAEPDRALTTLPVLSEAETIRLRAWQQTATLPDDTRCLHQIFEAQVRRDGTAIALVDDGATLSYDALNLRANRIAHAILAHGVRPDDRVALCAARGIDLIVGLLAILKAGGAYLPLDPTYASARTALVLEDARPVLLLADRAGRTALEGIVPSCPSIALDRAGLVSEPDAAADQDPVVPTLHAGHLAYVIYTSGSTGRPKGVMVEHRNVVHQVAGLRGALAIGSDERILQFASCAFDMSVEEIFPALLSGSALVLRDEICLETPEAFTAFCARHGLTSLNLPSGFWAQIALADPAVGLPASLRRVVVGGDAMSPAALSAWFVRGTRRPPLFNAYGPTEATVNATLGRVEAVEDASTIGHPLPNTSIRLLDRFGQPVPIGEPGEIWIGGAGVTRGYLDAPETTAARFVPDTAGPDRGARWYRTGDLARFRPDGSLQFLGRTDHQLKIRGYRVEAGEIEDRLARLPGLSDAVVVAFGEPHDRRLAAYLVAGGDAPDATALVDRCRAALAAALPDYMIPSVFIPLAALPLTASGKLDRRALPDPSAHGGGRHGFEVPRGAVEQGLADLWQELLGVDQVGRRDSFFALGGHSLIAMRLLGRARARFGRPVSLQMLFDHPTLAGLARAIETGNSVASEDGLPPIRAVPRDALMPLSSAQQRLWFLSQLEDTGGAYHIPVALHLDGPLHVPALRDALDHLVARHEALRTVFTVVDGRPLARLLAAVTPELREQDLSAETDPDAAIAAIARAHAAALFDLAHGPVIRAALLRRGSDRAVLLLCLHHIAGDGWSMDVLAREFGVAYAARVRGETPILPPLPLQYPDYAAWQQAVAAGGRLERQREYWREHLRGAPERLLIPTDRPRPARQSFAGAAVPVDVPPALSASLAALCRRQGVTSFMLFAAAWSMVLARLSGQDDVLLGTLTANRNQSETEPLIGFFANTLVLRADLSGNPDTLALLNAVRRTVLAMHAHQDLPFEQVVDAVNPSRRLEHAPLFQVLFAWQSNVRADWRLSGLQLTQAPFPADAIRFDLELHLSEQDGTVSGLLGYATALFDKSTAIRYRDHLLSILAGMAAAPDMPFRRLPMLAQAETDLLRRWNETGAPGIGFDRVHHLVENQALTTPEAVALIHGDRQLSYAALEIRAENAARMLRVLGAAAGQRIGLCVDRGFAMIASILAILKTGAAYVPLDPTYPRARLQQMLDDAGPLLVLTDATGRAALGSGRPGHPPIIDVQALESGSVSCPGGVVPGPVDADMAEDTAYVIYTSGSTGTPKGVAMPHGPLLNLIAWHRAQDALVDRTAPRTLQFAALGFDVAFQEIFATLGAGGSLVLIDAAQRLQFDLLASLLRRHDVQRVFLPTVALQALAEALASTADEASPLPSLRDLIVAGEQLRLTPQIRRLFARLPDCTLHNHYGPTETHVVTTQALRAAEVAGAPSHVPIGRPIGNVRAFVLDADRNPVPVGTVGELFIGGACLADGYLNRPDLTAERFVPDPFSFSPDEGRLYRTGDLARFLSDGRLVYAGRDDRQVKIRGFRVEIGEIEAHLSDHALVRECAVVVREAGLPAEGATGPADGQLVAYVVCDGSAADAATVLQAHLLSRLPEHMVPAAFVVLDRLPLTANGKLDRNALPVPDESAFARSVFAAPLAGTETVLAELWRQLLGVERIGRGDRFFDLGGHSLLAVRLLSRIEQTFGVALPLSALFARPALSDLADAIDQLRSQAIVIPDRAIVAVPREERLPLSHAQERLWFLAQIAGGDTATYHVHLAFQLRGVLDVRALRDALNRLAARHESLRTVFHDEAGKPFGTLLPPDTAVPLEVHDLCHAAEPEAARRDLLAEHRNAPFDLATGPLMRVLLLDLGCGRHALQITLHHMVADGWSLPILLRDLGRLHAETMPALSVQYPDYVAWERGPAQAAPVETATAYWARQLADAPALLDLPTDRPRPARQDFAGASSPFRLDAGLTVAVRRLAAACGVTLNTVLLAAWSVVLSRLAGQDEVVIGIPVAGRNRPELEELIGFFVNTLPLRITLDETLDTPTLLAQVQRLSLDGQAHAALPFDAMVDLVRAPRRLDRTPLFQAILSWQDDADTGLDLPGAAVEARLHDFDWVKFDLELIAGERDNAIHGALCYATALFDAETIERHCGMLCGVLAAMTRTRECPVSRIPLLSPTESRLLLDTWNRTATPFPDRLRLPGLVETHAETTPDAIALVYGAEQLSYAALDARANRLAHHLNAIGVRPEQRVASVLGRGINAIVVPLAVMKAGAVHLPLDPNYASARLALILHDADPAWILHDREGHAVLVGAGIDRTGLVDIAETGPASPASDHPPTGAGAGPRSLAYMIYTSGSTGTPKGVLVEHRGVVSLAHSLVRRFDISNRSRVSQFASPSFDASIMEMVMAFAAGAALHLPFREERENPAAFISFIGRERITHAMLPPVFLQGFCGKPSWTHRPALILAGEASPTALVKSWSRHAQIFNAYGPTEISICATTWRCPVDGELLHVPIGRAVDNARLYVLDRHRQPVPRGTVGELYIGGIGVARGYWKRPDLTTDRFLPDPFDDTPNARLYRSGDLVRYTADGDLLYLGRNDDQVKLRGFRIELGEIAAHLDTHPAVRESALMLREDQPGDRRLVAYVCTNDAASDVPATLRAHLADKLPDYMVPAAFVVLDRLPLTPHGKLDRRALPVPTVSARVRDRFVAPLGPTEQTLAGLWRDLLSVEQVGRHDDFFALGGHSLLAVRLAAAMRGTFGREVGPRDVFNHPVLSRLAATLVAPSAPHAPDVIDLAAEITLDAAILPPSGSMAYPARPQQILLTGVTGFVGAFLLDALLRHGDATVHCLVRCKDRDTGIARLDRTMRALDLRSPDQDRVIVHAGDLAMPGLGLTNESFSTLADMIDVVFHNGARVDALHDYDHLKAANVSGTREILRLAATGRLKHVHFISTMSTVPPPITDGTGIVSTDDLMEYWPGLPSGYARSKWVAERIVRLARGRGIPSTTYRLTHIGAASTTGASNSDDTWSLFVDACLTLRRVPAVGDAAINSLAVDAAAAAIVALSRDESSSGQELNLLNPTMLPLRSLTRAIMAAGGADIEEIAADAWRRLCIERLGNSKVSLILPGDEAVSVNQQYADPSLTLPNALDEARTADRPALDLTDTMLLRFAAWRRDRLGHGHAMEISDREYGRRR